MLASAAVSETKLPQLPGGPDPSKSVPRDPVRGVDLRGCAEVSARLAEAKDQREATLREIGMSELEWVEIEKTWLLRIAVAMMQGDTSLAVEYDALYAAAQDALGPAQPSRDLDQYAGVLADIEGGGDPADVLPRHGLTIAEFARLQRAWTTRAAADPALNETLRALVRARRS
jgi:hypothetical protein